MNATDLKIVIRPHRWLVCAKNIVVQGPDRRLLQHTFCLDLRKLFELKIRAITFGVLEKIQEATSIFGG